MRARPSILAGGTRERFTPVVPNLQRRQDNPEENPTNNFLSTPDFKPGTLKEAQAPNPNLAKIRAWMEKARVWQSHWMWPPQKVPLVPIQEFG